MSLFGIGAVLFSPWGFSGFLPSYPLTISKSILRYEFTGLIVSAQRYFSFSNLPLIPENFMQDYFRLKTGENQQF